ncbi:tetratricopeptide repeat protein [Motilimonas sp. 1_MG-2023]|uniref:tetratricopeptide repeat protein n=1 Tax=Motilimonas sp. 1_MG-2023 TaxID=3062672 RepID=UPI0026E18D68|nr:tetratricopeptide repeat protein [Motilimonas sp. 1_MG-2023]MDO6524142.1 tetratricopeptide repeat protein [Motilimonas sp. 1_MG-2023]
MSVINQMKRDLAKRQSGEHSEHNNVSPVLTSAPWFSRHSTLKGLGLVVLFGLTITAAFAWFSSPRVTSQATEAALVQHEVAVVASPVSQPLQPTVAATAKNDDQRVGNESRADVEKLASVENSETKPLVQAISVKSNDARIKVLDTQVVFLSELALSEDALVSAEPSGKNKPAIAVQSEQQQALVDSLEEKVQVISNESETAQTEASLPETSQVETFPVETVFITPAPSSAAKPMLAGQTTPSSELAVTKEQQPVVSPALVPSNNNELAAKATENQAIEIINVAPVVKPQPDKAAAEPMERSIAKEMVKPTPAGPSSLTITQSQLSDEELISLYRKQASTAKSKGDLAGAQVRLEKALAIAPANQQVRKDLVSIIYGRGNSEKAMALLNQGVKISPNNADFRLMQARIYLASQQRQQAFQALDGIKPDVKSNQDFYATKAALAQQLNQDEKALTAYLALAKQQPKQAKWWLGLGISQEKLGYSTDALRSYQQAELIGGLSLASMDYVRTRIEFLQ